MKLLRYCQLQHGRMAELAKILNMSRSMISQVAHQKRSVPIAHIKTIVEWSGGRIREKDLLDKKTLQQIWPEVLQKKTLVIPKQSHLGF